MVYKGGGGSNWDVEHIYGGKIRWTCPSRRYVRREGKSDHYHVFSVPKITMLRWLSGRKYTGLHE